MARKPGEEQVDGPNFGLQRCAGRSSSRVASVGGRERPVTGIRTGIAAGLVVVLATLGFTFLVAWEVKAPCADGGASWDDGHQYRRLCYSDIVPLYDNEHLQSGRLPFLDRCPRRSSMCDEYPVLTMYTMRGAAAPVHSHRGFLTANAVILAIAAIGIAVTLYRLVGRRALLFALAPTLALYGFMNWDLLAVLAGTLATAAAIRGRGRLCGVLCGIGTAFKLYPALLLVPFGLQRRREAGLPGAFRLGAAAALTWLGLNLPFALSAFDGWSTFYRFNFTRPADFDSLWYVTCQRLVAHQPPGTACPYDHALNLASLLTFVIGAIVLYRLRTRHDPDFARWTFGLPMLVLFLLSNKVYSPQYSLWLLPWFALVNVRLSRFLAFEAIEVVLFVARFSFLGSLKGVPGLGLVPFQLAVAARAVVLVLILVDWVRHGGPAGHDPSFPPTTLDAGRSADLVLT